MADINLATAMPTSQIMFVADLFHFPFVILLKNGKNEAIKVLIMTKKENEKILPRAHAVGIVRDDGNTSRVEEA